MNDYSRTPFVPIKGEEANLLLHDPAPGCFYIATNTGKMFLDVMDEITGEYVHKPIGGTGAALLYANSPEPTQLADGSYQLNKSELEDPEATVNIDDLLINTDGKFFRVAGVNLDGSILCSLIAVSGTGGGGGGGGDGGGGGAALGTANFTYITPATYNCRYGDAIKIKFNFTAAYADGTSSGNASATLHINNGLAAKTVVVRQGDNEIDVTDIITAGSQKLTIVISADIGGSSPTTMRRNWQIVATALEFNWKYDISTENYSDQTFRLSWYVSGDGVTKTTHIIIDGNEAAETQVLTTVSSKNESVDLPGLPHGVHTVEMYMSAEVGGEPLSTERTSYQLIFIDTNSQAPLIAYDVESTSVEQYNTLDFNIAVYDPEAKNNGNKITLTIRENDIDLETDTHNNMTLIPWTYTPDEYGIQKLTFVCKTTEVSVNIDVSKIDLGDVEETTGYAFKLKASELSGNKALQEWNTDLTGSIYNDWADKNVNLTFSDNFDWINGGLKSETLEDDTKRSYICVRAGTTMTINYDLFGVTSTAVRNSGKAFKFIFKATNCKQYDASVLSCYNQGIGIQLNAQKGSITTGATSLETQYYEDRYIEFEFDIWPNKTNTKGIDLRYIMFWLDGVPTGITSYASNSSHTQPAGHTVPITIGSNDCDVYVYLVKAYEKHLDDDEHLNNFIMDAYNATEMTARFLRNDILENGEISPTKLAEKNPSCSVFMYDIPRMTKNKKDKVGDGDEGAEDYITFAMYEGDGSTPKLLAENVRMKVQGTSSARYGVAAFNFDTDFKGGLTDAEGNELEGFFIRDENQSIPIDYTCTKVNVASSEGTNNAINQEWYNNYQPWISRVRRKNSKARDCMDFRPGVVFFKDRNTTTEIDSEGSTTVYDTRNVFADTDGYIAKPFYKQYSIGCMGNSKDNIEVFHDLTNPYEVCVENADNQEVGQWMTALQGVYTTIDAEGQEVVNYVSLDPREITVDNLDTAEVLCPDGTTRSARLLWENAMDELYEFRYPDGIGDLKDMFTTWTDEDKAKWPELSNLISEGILTEDRLAVNPAEAAIKGWYRFVSWMVLNDVSPYDAADHPYGYTGEDLPESETYSLEDLTLKNEYYSGSLKGQILSAYATTYTKDTKERRIAKMLSECEDYLAMESVVYHYLFIERHTMVDNVAKNTFWSTEDGLHWNLTKNYDNDTADGNDNQGRLSLTYGIECLDKNTSGKNYFNASQSTWLNFIGNLPSLRKALYKTCSDKNAWKATPYLNAHSSWQKSIPERCWIEDYYRKYRRPREIGEDDEGFYLGMLEGGQKSHQRAQYENYQESYIDSLYNVDNYEGSNVITFRSDGTLPLETDQETYPNLTQGIRVKLYADGYIRAMIGPHESVPVRGKRGQTYTIRFQSAGGGLNLNNATFYVAQANNISALLGIGLAKPTEMAFSAAKKLSELEVNTVADGPNFKLESLQFQSSLPLMEKIVVQYCPKINKPFDLSALTNLRELKTNGSGFTMISFADGGLVETAELNNISGLVATNLNKLTSLSLTGHSVTTDMEGNITSMTPSSNPIEGYNMLRSLKVINCPGIDTYSMVENIKESLTLDSASETTILTYCLKDVAWNINEVDDNINIAECKIPVLDYLLSAAATPAEDYGTRALSLDKSLTFGENVIFEEGITTTADDFYKKYVQPEAFPNLDIKFVNEYMPLVTIYDTAGNAQWQRRIVSGSKIDTNFLGGDNLAPNGMFTAPNDYSDAQYDYVFQSQWIAKVEGLEDVEIDNELPIDYTVVSDVHIYPVVEKTVKEFTVNFYHDDGISLHYSQMVPYGEYANIATPPVPPTWSGEEHPNMYYTYKFKGYAVHNGRQQIIDLATVKITSNMDFIACYEEEHVYKNPLSDSYFEVYDGLLSLIPGVILKGKITIPKTVGGVTVTGIGVGGFQKSTYNSIYTDDITHIFFEPASCEFDENDNLVSMIPNTSITTFGNNAFNGCGSQMIIELPPNINNTVVLGNPGQPFAGSGLKQVVYHKDTTIIPDGMFAEARSLQTINFAELAELTTIGKAAFQRCTALVGDTITNDFTLADFNKLVTIGDLAFDECYKLTLPAGAELTIPASVTSIGHMAFRNAFNSVFSVNFSSPNLTFGIAPFLAESSNNTNLGYSQLNYTLTETSFNATYDTLTSEEITAYESKLANLIDIDEDNPAYVSVLAVSLQNKTTAYNPQTFNVTCDATLKEAFTNFFRTYVHSITNLKAMEGIDIAPQLVINDEVISIV